MANLRFPPMGTGLDTAIDTGEPYAAELDDREAQRQSQRMKRMDRHYALLSDLTGQGGIVLQRIAERLIVRINELADQDPEARTLLGIIRDFQTEMSVGERLVQDELAAVLARDGQP